MKKALALFITLLLFHFANAQGYLKNKEEVAKYSEKVVMHFKEKQFTEVFTELRKYWPIPENEIVQLESQTIKQYNVVSEIYGKTLGAEFIKDYTVNEFIIRKVFVIRFEKHILRLSFTYYKGENGWILNSFKWDDKMDELFD